MTSLTKHFRFLSPKVMYRMIRNIVSVHTGTPRIRNCQIALTFVCNHTCLFCSSSLLNDKSKTILSIDEWKTTIDELYELGCTHIDITGGEPTLKGEQFLKELISYITRNKDMIVSLATNARLITPTFMISLKNSGLNTILFNLQALDQKIHDEQVQENGNYQHIMYLIPVAQRIGLNVGINTCLGTYNFKEIRELADWCEEEDIILCINLAAPTGELVDEDVRMTDFKNEYYKFLKSYSVVRSDTSFNYRGANICPGGIEKIYITAYGEVMQCTFCQVSFGNIKETKLKDIYSKICSIPMISKIDICKHTFNKEYREFWIDPIINNPNPPIKLEDHPNFNKLGK